MENMDSLDAKLKTAMKLKLPERFKTNGLRMTIQSVMTISSILTQRHPEKLAVIQNPESQHRRYQHLDQRQENSNTYDMDKKDLKQMTDQELIVEKKKHQNSKIFHATWMGFLIGIIIFGIVSWSLSTDKQVAFLIPMLIIVLALYKMLKNPNKNGDLEEILKERGLN